MVEELKKSRLNVLPENPQKESDSATSSSLAVGRFPKWLHRKLPKGNELWKTHDILNSHRLPTVCEEARCPNLPECYSKKTATFLAMGKACTRSCGFCDIDFEKQPKALEADEPLRLAQSVKELGLKHAVITMVARDDIVDGGSNHLKKIIEAVREHNEGVTIEVLTSDFEGIESSFDTILEAKPEIFNHNLETVRRLTPKVRHKATYERSLQLLSYIKKHQKSKIFVKSGLMVGLGETPDEIKEALLDLARAGCDIVTIGHYLQPSRKQLTVKSFITPKQFEEYGEFGRKHGISHMYVGPFVRSSYNAASLFESISKTS